MITTMKQGVISLIPKPDKDNLLIENWRPITLLTIDYKILASVYAARLKICLPHIVAETQSGFIKDRHISNNIRLVLDLLDYADSVHSEAFILFLDFYKAGESLSCSSNYFCNNIFFLLCQIPMKNPENLYLSEALLTYQSCCKFEW